MSSTRFGPLIKVNFSQWLLYSNEKVDDDEFQSHFEDTLS